MKKILIIGSTSAIAEATARLWAAEGHRLYLLGRNAERLAVIAADLKIRGAETVQHAPLDVNDVAQHAAVLEAAAQALGGLDVVLIAHGTLGDQKASEQDFNVTLQELNTNAISVISLLTHLANRFEAQKHGSIAVISSVAGDRGRHPTMCTARLRGGDGLPAGVAQPLAQVGGASADRQAGVCGYADDGWHRQEGVVVGQTGGNCAGAGKRRDVIYTPWFWAVMLVIRMAPECVFKKLRV